MIDCSKNGATEHEIFSCEYEKHAPIRFGKFSYANIATFPPSQKRICCGFELLIILEHCTSIMINDIVFVPNWGDVVIIREGDTFQPLHIYSPDKYYYKISFSAEFIRKQPSNSPFREIFTSENYGKYSLIDTLKETSYALFEHIRKIENALDLKDNTSQRSAFLSLTDLVKCISNELLLKSGVASDTVGGEIPGAIHFALQYIFDNYLVIKNTSEIAKESHISVSYLCAIFKKHMKCSPVDIINSCKISHAKHLLINGHKATEVCYLSGFNHYNYFAETFKKKWVFLQLSFAKIIDMILVLCLKVVSDIKID